MVTRFLFCTITASTRRRTQANILSATASQTSNLAPEGDRDNKHCSFLPVTQQKLRVLFPCYPTPLQHIRRQGGHAGLGPARVRWEHLRFAPATSTRAHSWCNKIKGQDTDRIRWVLLRPQSVSYDKIVKSAPSLTYCDRVLTEIVCMVRLDLPLPNEAENRRNSELRYHTMSIICNNSVQHKTAEVPKCNRFTELRAGC